MTTLPSFHDFAAFVAALPDRTVCHVACGEKGYDVEYYPPALPELIPATPERLYYPPAFTFHFDPIGCERMANARGRKK